MARARDVQGVLGESDVRNGSALEGGWGTQLTHTDNDGHRHARAHAHDTRTYTACNGWGAVAGWLDPSPNA